MTAALKHLPVKIVKAEEPWVRLTLEDGSVISARMNIAAVTREQGTWDTKGNPIYNFDAVPAFSLEAPAHLKRGGAI